MAARQEISLGQFVKQLAGLLQIDGQSLPFRNQKAWHLLFYELSKEPDSVGKPTFLDKLVFDWDAPYPKCQELAEFLNALHFTATVSARNPSFSEIMVDPEVAKRWVLAVDEDEPAVRDFLGSAVERAKQEFSQTAAG